MAKTLRITDMDNWFDIWFADKKGMIETMVSNMASDLDNGYDYFGHSIRQQREMIEAYKAKFDSEMDSFKTMTDEAVNRWCFYDMKKRGVIE